ncbi:hypothetical protein D3C75_1347610 [compost metagenome]
MRIRRAFKLMRSIMWKHGSMNDSVGRMDKIRIGRLSFQMPMAWVTLWWAVWPTSYCAAGRRRGMR